MPIPRKMIDNINIDSRPKYSKQNCIMSINELIWFIINSSKQYGIFENSTKVKILKLILILIIYNLILKYIYINGDLKSPYSVKIHLLKIKILHKCIIQFPCPLFQ